MKNKILYGLLTIVAVGLFACSKNEQPKSLNDFSVSGNKTTIKVGDTVTFSLYGNPGEVIFFSGEPGKKYENSNRTLSAGVDKLIFQTNMQQGTLANNDSLRLLISPDLKGYDSVSVLKATWLDITSKNTKWPTTLTSSYTTSDSIDITHITNSDSVNIAFRAIGKKNAAAAQRKWQVQGFALTNYQPDGTKYQLFSAPYAGTAPSSAFAYTGWVHARLKYNNTAPGFNAWNVGTVGVSAANSVNNSSGVKIATGYPLTFDPGTAVNNSDNDDWVITTKVNLKTVFPDPGVVIKNVVNAAVTNMTYFYNDPSSLLAKYTYKFTNAGVYNVTFVGLNVTPTGTNKNIQTIQVTVNP